jgi:hypothetical protein
MGFDIELFGRFFGGKHEAGLLENYTKKEARIIG